MFTAADILIKAGIQLNDEDAVRWSFSERAYWVNAGLKAIVIAKPSASSKSVVLPLAVGTLQQLPPAAGSTYFTALLRINRNILAEGPPRVGGRAIRSTTRDVLDLSAPDWHNPAVTRFKAEVRQYVFDEAVPREYYVYPGNDGTGKIEAVVSFMPPKVVATGADDDIASWQQPIDFDPMYEDVVLDYLMFRALSRDDLDGNRGRAQAHFNAFAQAVGLKIQTEAASGPNARAGVTQS